MGRRESRSRDATRAEKVERRKNEGLTGDGNSTESELGLDVEDTVKEKG